MNTLIENLNALMTVKKELNKVLVDNEQPGGPVFDTYPEQFRELFRVLEDKLDDIEEGPYATYQPETVVAKPTIGFENNVVTLTCATQGAQIYFRTEDVYGNKIGWGPYNTRFSISRDTYVETYAILNGIRSSEPDNGKWCYYVNGSSVPAPEFDRTNGIVTITCRQQGAQIWWRIMPSTTFVLYTGPELVDGTKWLEAYAVYQGKGSETAISEGTEEGITVADPVLTCSDNIVTITCATEDAVIWYKTNLGDEWTVYTEPIEISVDTIFEAYAYKDGNISNTVTYTAEYEEPYVPPVVVPADPVISCSNNVVTITCSTSGATIYYSTDNGVTYNEYTGTITISADTTFYAYSELNGETSNTVSYEAQYEDSPQPPQPVAPADPVFSCVENTVTITCATPGATIRYKTYNDNYYKYYNSPIEIGETTIFYAYSTKDGLNSDYVTYEAVYTDYVYSYGKEINPDSSYYNMPFTVSMLENGEFKYLCSYSNANSDEGFINRLLFQYKLNNNEWIVLTKEDLTIERSGGGSTAYSWSISYTFNLSQNDVLSIKVIQDYFNSGIFGYWNHFKSTGKCNIYGNLLSLVYLNDWTEYTNHKVNVPMRYLFQASKIVSAENLILPQYMGVEYGYYYMFKDNTDLINPPKIDHINTSTNTNNSIFTGMFEGCTSLVDIPKLPTPLWDNTYGEWKNTCYFGGMFKGCTSLRTNIIIDARTNENQMRNYYKAWGMFDGCTSMHAIKVLLDIRTNYENNWLSHLGTGLNTNVYGKISVPTNTSVTKAELDINNTNWSINYY